MAMACSWTRALSSSACCLRRHSIFQRRKKTAPSSHMTPVVARQTGPVIWSGRCVCRVRPTSTKPKTVERMPMTRNTTEKRNMRRPATSRVVQRFVIVDVISSWLSLSIVEIEERDSCPGVDADGAGTGRGGCCDSNSIAIVCIFSFDACTVAQSNSN